MGKKKNNYRLLPSFKPPAENYTRVAFDVAVALVCLLSLVLCGRSILRGVVLQQVGSISNSHQTSTALSETCFGTRVLRLPFISLVALPQEFVQYFKENLDRKVCWTDRLEFINGWFILLIVSDIFTITGSIIKIGIESKVQYEAVVCVVALQHACQIRPASLFYLPLHHLHKIRRQKVE